MAGQALEYQPMCAELRADQLPCEVSRGRMVCSVLRSASVFLMSAARMVLALCFEPLTPLVSQRPLHPNSALR